VFTKIELPPKYYLTHFQELRAVLLLQYGAFFGPEHHAFFSDFDELTEDAQCLYLRLLNRRGQFFFKESLKYKEIDSFEEALSLLFEKCFIRSVNESDLIPLLDFLPKPCLLELALKNGIDFKKSWSRDRLKDELKNFSSTDWPEIVIQDRMAEVSYLLFLYFGKIQDNLSLYTLRDLGVRKVNSKKTSFKARFVSREDALSHYFFARLSQDIDQHPVIETWPVPLNSESKTLKEDVLLALAENYKKAEEQFRALEILKHSMAHPGREKRVRLLYQLDLKDECLKELNELLEAPYTDGEFLFAEDFLARKFYSRRRSILTETLRNAQKISIDESYFRHPELGVIDHFKEQGIVALHLENYLWNCLFGLLFWEELFESDKTSLYNEFERRPQDLYSKAFYEIHEGEIHAKLDVLSLEYLLRKIEDKKDVPNGVFGWHESIPDNLKLFLESSPPQSVKDILVHMAKDFVNRSTGFPDLLVIKEGKAKFYEIKAEGDVLKQTQLLQMLALQKAGFEVEILQVEYAFNPDQLYVVVDIETTGGGQPYHRITELGAVKTRNGAVIDRFQTLVNPERFISREIEALTGISNAMVKNAPKFAEVMDAFDEFTKDAIFVAHNVSFDYGFIQAEFNREERRYVRPYICTKVGMKKHYPGLESYSLKNLTKHFNVSLETHHRALCDAEAAAGLLFLINQKRAE
jgi:DNA polymerase-3 subunit epsilon